MMETAMASADTNSLPSAREFLALSRKHSLVPVYRTVTADLETPVSAFLRIASEEPEAFLLESVEGGEHVGRYTFIGDSAIQEDGCARERGSRYAREAENMSFKGIFSTN